jgi:hypothetical protein
VGWQSSTILEGEGDARRLAALRDGRVKASEESILAALEGDYRGEHGSR